MDKTDKQMILMMIACIAVVVVLGFITGSKFSVNGSPSFFNIGMTPTPKVTEYIADEGKKYEAVIDTSEGSFTAILYPKSAPKLVGNMYQYAKDGFFNNSKISFYDEKVGLYLGLDKDKNEAPKLVNEDIDAIDLSLNTQNVQSISTEISTFNEGRYELKDVNSNLSLSIKEFNEKYFDISYSSNVESKPIKKYSLISKTTGNNNLNTEFIITTTSNNRYLDGRKVHFGDITSGMNVVDMIMKKSPGSVTINSISITEK